MARIIALVGGGTMGPTAPLLALHDFLHKKNPRDKFIWVGTKEGPERMPVESRGIPFTTIPSAKIPRYLSFRFLTWPLDYYKARNAAKVFLDKYKPDIIIGAGGFTQVPIMHIAAWRKIPCLVHQLDFVPSLSNLAVQRHCKFITTTFIYHYKKFRFCRNEQHIATPNRFFSMDWPDKKLSREHFGFKNGEPLVLVVGGGTGSRALNEVIESNLDKWLKKVQILHLTGKGRSSNPKEQDGYKRYEFLDRDDLLRAYIAADIVISRAGMGGITDLATLSKPTILVPIPRTHQEKNTRHLMETIIEVKESANLFEDLYTEVRRLRKDPEKCKHLGYELSRLIKTDDGAEWAEIIERYLPEDLE